MDREQKLFLEASDWEAKFYQIQSKYLLLLNELHNPQVMVSASRQEMVGLLLKDIVDNSEKPTLNSDTPEHDRFGFRFEEGASLIEKAERLQRIAEENLAETELSLEEVDLTCGVFSSNSSMPDTILPDTTAVVFIEKVATISIQIFQTFRHKPVS